MYIGKNQTTKHEMGEICNMHGRMAQIHETLGG